MENKKEFVEKYLQPLLKEIDKEIESVEYIKETDEMVEINLKGGTAFCVNVTCDRNLAIVKDVLRSERYEY